MTPKYPLVEVQLTGRDGNSMILIGAVSKALRQHGVEQKEISEFASEAMSGDYDNVLRTCMRWVDVS